ncbi:uncharacterized protein LOC118414154 isoform X1 [Branchiostoma floridae]|uniref:Uncharacterized protein LOC118414154 isoform X1 n=1 Tax=Branchiostoma floridae TaxID=7739 RepID=A0A9J7L1V0_BRAFL|nr:uncharacterized protein LOC118414154 isoform X1 [Branchiostoma floridae]
MTLKMYPPATFARYKMYMSPQERRLVKSAPDKLWSQPQTSWTSTTTDESLTGAAPPRPPRPQRDKPQHVRWRPGERDRGTRRHTHTSPNRRENEKKRQGDRISREVASAPDNAVKQTSSRQAAPTLPKINNLFVQTGSTAGISTCASNSNKSKTFAKGWAEARAETVGRNKLPATINGRADVKNSARSCPDLSRNKVTLPQRAQTTTDGKNKKNSSCPQTAALRSQGGLPHWKSEHILTPREVQTYSKLKSVYLNDTWQKQRRNFILQKLEDIQLEEVKRYARDVQHRKKRLLETIETQKKQLADVRQKYENEQLQRFRSQYVTWKSVETEKLTRHIYGLPEDLNKDMVPKTNLKRKSKPPKKRWRQAAQRAVNVKKFASILKPTGTRPVELKDPLMDGIDTVLLETDSSSAKPKKKMVKSVLQEAKNIIHEADDTNIDTFSEVSTPASSRAGSDDEDDGSDSDSWQSINSDDPIPKLYSSEDTDREE